MRIVFTDQRSRAIEHQVQKNLDPSLLSPFNAIDEYQRFASALVYRSSAPPNTRTHDEGMKITFKEHTLDVRLWRKALAGLADRVAKNLDELCYHEDFGMKVPEKVPDDWTNFNRSYGWVDNADFMPDRLALLHRMIKDDSLDLARVTSDGKIELKSAAIWKVLDRCATINHDLALLCFFVNSQNTRISEYVEHKLRNSTRPRTCFFEDFTKSIWLVTRRLKTKHETFIPLKCPPIVSELLIKYCTIVRPVEEHIAFHARGPEARTLYREYLWVQNCAMMSKDTMYNAVPAFLESTINDRIGIHDYRQIVVEMSRIFLGSEYEMEQEQLDVLAASRGHSEDTARMRYAQEAGHLPGLSSELLLRFGRGSEQWWHVTGFKHGCPPLQSLRTRQGLLAKLAPKSSVSNNSDQPQSVHDPQDLTVLTTTMQTMIGDMQTAILAEMKAMLALALPDPARLEAQINDAVVKAVQQNTSSRMFTSTPPPFPPSSEPSFHEADLIDMHQDFNAIYEPEQETVDPIVPIEEAAPAESEILVTQKEADWQPTAETKGYLLHLLAQHFPDQPDPSFKSLDQMRAAGMALAREENFVLVMPTGSGKSLVFTLPPFNEPGFRTYVIVPNRALLQDHLQRCKQIGLPVFHWLAQHRTVPDDAQIVLLVLETATSQTFRM